MNITLIGMAGAGKSYIGGMLAERMGLEFFDIDRAMEKREGKPLQEILDSLGDEAFVEAEEAFIIANTGRGGLLISPGGSIVYSENTMRHLRDISHIIHLRVPYETIEARISGVPRGIVGLKGKTLREVYDERLPLYERYAHASFDADTDAPDELAAAIEKSVML